jgi:hypothetical protein
MYQLLQQQAALWAYVDLFRLLAGAGLRPALATGVLVQKRLTTAPEGGGHGALTFFSTSSMCARPFVRQLPEVGGDHLNRGPQAQHRLRNNLDKIVHGGRWFGAVCPHKKHFTLPFEPSKT